MFRKFSFYVSFVLVLCMFGSAWGVEWAEKDIGDPGIAGSSSYDAGTDTWTVLGSGHDVWGNADGGHYVYKPMSGNGSITVNLLSMDETTSGWAKVGPAIRETATASSRHAMTAMTGSNGVQFVWRENTGGGSGGVSVGGEVPPKYLRMTRAGNLFTAEFGYKLPWKPTVTWEWADSHTVLMDVDVTIGMFVCATNQGALNTAVMSNVVIDAAPYPKPWDLSPEDGIGGVTTPLTLDWKAGDGAISHEVYLGTDPAALPLVATKAVGDEGYIIAGPLAEGTTYYWKIVEQPTAAEGPVRSFTTYAPPCGIERCVWLGIGGGQVPDFTSNPAYPDSPSWCDILTSMASYDFADNYGAWMQGLLWPETDGDYTFWIAADDGCELWLSTDDDPANLVQIAGHTGWTSAHQWYDYPSQQSVPVTLVGDQKYFIRALWKEGGGGDNCQVAWQGPDQPLPIIGGNPQGIITDYYFPLCSPEASNPDPVDGDAYTPLELEGTNLSWTVKRGTTSQDVYFGEAGSMTLLATLGPDQDSLPLPPTELDKTYEWKVDLISGTDVVEGNVWSFSVAEWVSMDIGRANPEPAGSSSYDEATDTYVLNSGGNELWGTSDEFHYRFTTMEMTRDIGAIQARVVSITNVNSWLRSGVQIRESRAPNARKFMMHKTAHDNTRFQYREQPGWDTWNGADWWDLGFPLWVRLDRNGSNFDAYHSYDGENWIHRGSAWCPMEPGKFVLVGLAHCHHNNQPQDQVSTGIFDNLTITTPDPRLAWGLNPPNGSTMVDIHATLTWNPGEGVTEHRVYFSADEEAVINRTVDPIVLPAETLSVEVGPLDMGMVYYWCVDEVINPVVQGEVISFTAEDYRTIDDFESYDVSPEELPPQIQLPDEVILEAVPPPDQEWIEPQEVVIVAALDPGTDCLVSRWDFEGDFTDSGPGGNDGTANGDAVIVTDAERGDVLSLDGDADYVDCGNPANLDFGTGNWTVSVWINTTVTGKPKGVPYAKGGDGSGGKRYTLGVGESKSNRVTLTVDDNSDKKQSHGSTHVTDGVWHHVMGVRNGGRIYIYTDGKLEDNDGLPGGTSYDLSGTSQANAYIGCIWNQGGSKLEKWFTGMIDDVRVYNCALTAGNARYLAGIGDLTAPKPGYYSPLIAHYAFDEGSGDTATDSSGNGLHGAISGAVYTTTTADGSASCLDFNGFGDNVFNGLAGPYLNLLDELSISLWIKSDVIETDKGFFMGSASGSDRHGIRYDRIGGSADPDGNDVIKYGVRTYEGNEEDESSQFLQTTEWQHVVMTWKSGVGMTLWINGVQDFPTFDAPAKGSITEGYNRLWVGKGSKDMDADEGWDGLIDDVRVYARHLPEAEVRWLAGVGDILAPARFVPLVLHYEFEGNLDDSSGNARTGTAHGAVGFETDPDMGDVLDLPGGSNQYVSAPQVGISGNNPTTIACWAKADHTSIPDWSLIFGFTGTPAGGGDCGSHFNIGSIGGPGGVGAHTWCWERTIFSDTEALDWRHYAMTFDGGTVKYYGDGIQIGQDGMDLWRRGDRVHVGSRVTQDSSFPGNVDDARVYDYPLTLGQIRTLAHYVPTNDLGDTWSGRAAAAPALEYLEPAHEGNLSMRVAYTGSGAVTRLEPFGDGKHPHGWNGDFSLGKAQALSLWFKGDSENAPGTMFAQLTTVVPSGHIQRVMYDGDPEDLLKPIWQEWTMSLKALSTGKPADPIDEMGLPITKIKDVGVGIIGAGSGVLYFDDLRLYPTRCVPKYGPRADLNGDCVVDRGDLNVLAAEWLAQPEDEEYDRVAYYDDRYPTGWADPDVAQGVRDYLVYVQGYTLLNADELKTWMDARIADHALSVVVMCQDIAPDTVAETPDASCTLRKYLDAGGKVVQYADIPFYNQGHADGTTTNWATGGSIGILGFNAAGAGWNSGDTVTITPAGADWGLTQAWAPSLRPALPGDVDIILATDSDGDAAGWVKRYVPGNTRGFVYIIDLDVNTSHVALLPELAMVAEYIGALTADLNEDDIVNFFDYTDLLNHFGEELLFPPPGEEL